jgi:mono/diheme cytochrome c family protein
MIRFLCALALVPLLAGPVLACPPAYRSAYVSPVVYDTPVIVTPAIVTTLVAIPTYSATYVAPAVAPVVAQPAAQAAPQASACESRLQVLADRLAALEARQSPQSGPAGSAQTGANESLPPPTVLANPTAGLAVFQNRCAACHDAAKVKGTQPAFRKDGQILSPDCGTAADAMAVLLTGKMGKQKPPDLTDQEAVDLTEFLKTQAHAQLKK